MLTKKQLMNKWKDFLERGPLTYQFVELKKGYETSLDYDVEIHSRKNTYVVDCIYTESTKKSIKDHPNGFEIRHLCLVIPELEELHELVEKFDSLGETYCMNYLVDSDKDEKNIERIYGNILVSDGNTENLAALWDEIDNIENKNIIIYCYWPTEEDDNLFLFFDKKRLLQAFGYDPSELKGFVEFEDE